MEQHSLKSLQKPQQYQKKIDIDYKQLRDISRPLKSFSDF